MAIFVNEIKPMLVYKGNYVLPINKKDRYRGSVVYLLTPTINTSINYMNSISPINQINFKSYFLEKNVQLILNNSLQESMTINDEIIEGANYSLLEAFKDPVDDISLTEDSLKFNDTDNHQNRVFFSDIIDSLVDQELLEESDTQFTNAKYNFNNMLRMLLFHERMKNQSDCLKLYEEIKAQVKYIEFTFVDTNLYKGKNLFYDWSYYTEIFFKNNKFIGDKALDLFWNFINRFIQDKRFNDYIQKTIVIPVNDWVTNTKEAFDYKTSINPISMLYRGLKHREGLFNIFSNYTVLFTNENRFFRMDFNDEPEKSIPRFMGNIQRLINEVETADTHLEDKEDSKEVIVLKLSEKLKKSGIRLNNLTVSTPTMSKEQLSKAGLLKDPSRTEDMDVKKAALVNKLEKVAASSKTPEEALESLDNSDDKDKVMEIFMDLQSDDGVKMDKARKARYDKAQDDYMNIKLRGKKVSELLDQFETNNELKETSIPIDSIDDHWKHVKYPNFNETYTKEDMQADIVAMYNHFNHTKHPMNIVKLEVDNTSTSEDYKDTWTIQFEDAETGKRFSSKIDIPRMVGNRFMKLRGNEKVLIGQIMLLPIVKTDDDTVQIVSNYNKIFVRRKSPSGFGKSTATVNKLCKILTKYTGKDMKVITGSNAKLYKKYELPIAYIDMGNIFSKIQFKDGSYISFNNDNLNKIPFDRSTLSKTDSKLTEEELQKSYPASCYVNSKGQREINFNTNNVDEYILGILLQKIPSLSQVYNSTPVSKRLMFSEASILNSKIPVVIVCAYSIGLQKVMERAGIKFELSEKRPTKGDYYIRFADGYLIYHPTTNAHHMLMNGLNQIPDISVYSLAEMNKKDMWLGVLDDFGGRIKADGLDNFYDLMMDPITTEICQRLNLPDNYIDALIYASGLLLDNKFNRHTDITGNRIRVNEVIVGHLYQVLAKEYGAYRNMIKRNKGEARFTVKQSAVIDSVLNHDQTSSDLSTLTPLLEAEAASKVTFKGLSGMNSERAFSIEKRSYDDSMLGVLGLSTGFANTVGINRQTTIDAGILNKRGFISPKNPKQLDNLSTFTIMEGLSPLAINRDDGIRTCMAFTQTVQHQMAVRVSMPNLVTTGTDEALPYLTSNKFSYKFKGNKGKVLEATDDYIILEDTETHEKDFIDLREKIQKNSDGGFFVTTKLDANTNIKPGKLLKFNDIVAYNKTSYSPAIGNSKDPNAISYNLGTLGKVAIAMSDLGFEDSCVVDEYLSEALTTEICVQKEVNLPPTANLYDVVRVGQHIEEGEPLLIFSDQIEDEDANAILQNLVKDSSILSDVGRKQIHSKCTGTVQDIKVYRTCDLSDLSPSLRKFVNSVETKINKLKSKMRQYNIDKEYELEPSYKLSQEGKLKNFVGVRIEIYVKTVDIMGVGDKLVYNNGLKGVVSYIIQRDEIATSEYRPDEAVNTFLAMTGVAARMVPSAMLLGLVNKGIVELTRQTQEDLGIKWKPMHEILNEAVKAKGEF